MQAKHGASWPSAQLTSWHTPSGPSGSWHCAYVAVQRLGLLVDFRSGHPDDPSATRVNATVTTGRRQKPFMELHRGTSRRLCPKGPSHAEPELRHDHRPVATTPLSQPLDGKPHEQGAQQESCRPEGNEPTQ